MLTPTSPCRDQRQTRIVQKPLELPMPRGRTNVTNLPEVETHLSTVSSRKDAPVSKNQVAEERLEDTPYRSHTHSRRARPHTVRETSSGTILGVVVTPGSGCTGNVLWLQLGGGHVHATYAFLGVQG